MASEDVTAANLERHAPIPEMRPKQASCALDLPVLLGEVAQNLLGSVSMRNEPSQQSLRESRWVGCFHQLFPSTDSRPRHKLCMAFFDSLRAFTPDTVTL